MPWIRVHPVGPSIQVPAGSSLLDAVHVLGMPIATACGAGGLCGRCGVDVCGSAVGLSREQPEEARAKLRNRIPAKRRLACCARVLDDVRIATPYW